MGFVTIGALNMQSVDFDSSSSSRRSWRNDPDERFYEKTMMVRGTKKGLSATGSRRLIAGSEVLIVSSPQVAAGGGGASASAAASNA